MQRCQRERWVPASWTGAGQLPPHPTVELSLRKAFGENRSLRLRALNLNTNHSRLDNTFARTHFTNPREFTFQLKYRFHF